MKREDLKRQVETEMEGEHRKFGFLEDLNYEETLDGQITSPDSHQYTLGQPKANSRPDFIFSVLAELTDSLAIAMSGGEATEIVLRALYRGIGVRRALCLAYDPLRHVFVGHLMENSILSEITLGGDLDQIQQYLRSEQIKDIEYSSIMHLATALGGANEHENKEDPTSLWADINGLWATFFWTKDDHLISKSPVIGQLIVDVVDEEEIWQESTLAYKEKIRAVSRITSRAIERLLLAQAGSEKPQITWPSKENK